MRKSQRELRALLEEEAREAARCSYSPYSAFPVGASVLTEGGTVVSGCNVENASFGLTICAERNAVFAAVAKGARRIEALLLYTPTERPTLPCGACRQVLLEFGPEARIISICDGEEIIETKLSALFPRPFLPANLPTKEKPDAGE